MSETLSGRISALLLALVPDLPGAAADPDDWFTANADRALELSSLQVMQLVDAIEASTGLLLTSDDVARTHFATAGALVARLSARGLG